MIPILLYVLAAIRRALQKLGRSLLTIADAFYDAQECARAARRRYGLMDE